MAGGNVTRKGSHQRRSRRRKEEAGGNEASMLTLMEKNTG